jgi:hypothetical protein
MARTVTRRGLTDQVLNMFMDLPVDRVVSTDDLMRFLNLDPEARASLQSSLSYLKKKGYLVQPKQNFWNRGMYRPNHVVVPPEDLDLRIQEALGVLMGVNTPSIPVSQMVVVSTWIEATKTMLKELT